MPFTPANTAAVARLLPPIALDLFCKAASEAEQEQIDHNGCIRQGWAAVKSAGWEAPATGKKWVLKDDGAVTTGDGPTAGSVHVDVPLGSKKPKKKPDEMEKFDIEVAAAITKIGDDESRMAYGWASVISEGGEPHEDTQGDIISADEMLKATTDFMADARMAKAMHEGGKVGEVLHSFPLTADLAKSLGIDCDKEGWIVGVKVHDDATWASVKDGTLQAFSIGGTGSREEVAA